MHTVVLVPQSFSHSPTWSHLCEPVYAAVVQTQVQWGGENQDHREHLHGRYWAERIRRA